MAKNVKLETYDCGTSKCIKVDKHLVRTKKNHVVKFNNKLDGTVDASIQFFDADDKDSPAPLTGFCTEEAGDTLTVANNIKQKCTVTENVGDFAYTVKATGHLDLDPIIIIEPSAQSYGTAQSQSQQGSVIICAVIALVVALLGFWFGTRKNS